MTLEADILQCGERKKVYLEEKETKQCDKATPYQLHFIST